MDTGRPLSFSTDIRPMFTDTDVAHMLGYGMNLGVFEDVAAHATDILAVVRSGEMPPPSESRTWTEDMCDTFEQWMNQGSPP